MKTGRDLKPQKVGPDLQFNLNAPAAHPFDQHSVRRRIDRLWRRDPTGLAYVLQPGRRSSGGLGEGAAGADADLRCDHRSPDRRMLGSHAIAMGPAPSVHVRFRRSTRHRILFSAQPALGWSQRHLLVHMVAMLVTVRVLLSIYEIPSSALRPELTLDYDQRTA
jgi:hypothetical protein